MAPGAHRKILDPPSIHRRMNNARSYMLIIKPCFLHQMVCWVMEALIFFTPGRDRKLPGASRKILDILSIQFMMKVHCSLQRMQRPLTMQVIAAMAKAPWIFIVLNYLKTSGLTKLCG